MKNDFVGWAMKRLSLSLSFRQFFHLFLEFCAQVYVEAVNEHGTSEPSQRVVFRTASQNEKNAEIEASLDNYNETACCAAVSLCFLYSLCKSGGESEST